jgi:glycosyltransferase involved in cell wall biosynthesis
MKELSSGLVGLGWPVTVICRSDISTFRETTECPVRRLPRDDTLRAKVQLLAALAREVALHDAVLCNGLERYCELVCRVLRRHYVLKVVGDLAWERMRVNGMTMLSVDQFQAAEAVSEPGGTWRRRRTSSAKNAAKVITPSEYLRRMVIGWGVAPERVVVVPNGVHLEHAEAFASRPRTLSPLDLIFVGRLVNWKGVDHLLKALVGLQEVSLSIVGDGPEQDNLIRQAGALGLSQIVKFCGRLPREEVIRKMSASHVLVLPSSYEGLSHVLLEAGAIGLPCIASDSGGNPEVILHGKTGLLVRYGDVEQLRTAIVRLRDDEPLRSRLATGARERGREFSFERTLQGTIQALGL